MFREKDYYDDFLKQLKKLKHNNYPILNSNDECLGLIRITDIVKKNNKEVMLVDHHKIGNINTNNPINFRNMTVGSSNPILYYMFEENNVEIPKENAGLMLSGILSDTLCLQSPTSTNLDREVVEKLLKIAGVDYEKICT